MDLHNSCVNNTPWVMGHRQRGKLTLVCCYISFSFHSTYITLTGSGTPPGNLVYSIYLNNISNSNKTCNFVKTNPYFVWVKINSGTSYYPVPVQTQWSLTACAAVEYCNLLVCTSYSSLHRYGVTCNRLLLTLPS